MLHTKLVGDYFALDPDECRAAGRSLASQYQNAAPFPHIVLDDFLDRSILKKIADEFPSSGDKEYFDREQERLKYQYRPHEVASGVARNLFAELNSEAFLGFLEELTSFEGLLPDPYFAGGGLHETKRGGHLGIHADFNGHAKLKVERKLNLLVYLNEDWEDSYGGQLELWDQQMKSCVVRVKPVFGRAVIFNTDLDSFHGHPDPLECPPTRSRRSIATYYYQAPEEGFASLPKRSRSGQSPCARSRASFGPVRRMVSLNNTSGPWGSLSRRSKYPADA